MQEKEGEFFDLSGNWTNKYPATAGQVKIGSYEVPANTRSAIKLIWPFAEYENMPRAMSGVSMNIGTVKFQVNGADKAEMRLTALGQNFAGGVGPADFDVCKRDVQLFDGLIFAENDVLRLIITQEKLTTTGIPQVLYLAAFAGDDATTGGQVIQKARTIITNNTADQVIITYTVPANGFILKNIILQAFAGDYILNHIQLRINGELFAELPQINTAYRTLAGKGMRGMLMFYDGLNINHGDTIEARADPLLSVNQNYNMIIAGDETEEEGGGGGGECSYVF